MKFEFAFLADAATMLDNGTFDVVGGGFDVVKGRSFPATKGAMVFIARLWFEPQECGKEYKFSGGIFNREGHPIYPPFRGAFVPATHAKYATRGTHFNVCVSAELVQFPTPGDYFFRLSIDEKPVGEVIIEAVLEE